MRSGDSRRLSGHMHARGERPCSSGTEGWLSPCLHTAAVVDHARRVRQGKRFDRRYVFYANRNSIVLFARSTGSTTRSSAGTPAPLSARLVRSWFVACEVWPRLDRLVVSRTSHAGGRSHACRRDLRWAHRRCTGCAQSRPPGSGAPSGSGRGAHRCLTPPERDVMGLERQRTLADAFDFLDTLRYPSFEPVTLTLIFLARSTRVSR